MEKSFHPRRCICLVSLSLGTFEMYYQQNEMRNKRTLYRPRLRLRKIRHQMRVSPQADHSTQLHRIRQRFVP